MKKVQSDSLDYYLFLKQNPLLNEHASIIDLMIFFIPNTNLGSNTTSGKKSFVTIGNFEP